MLRTPDSVPDRVEVAVEEVVCGAVFLGAFFAVNIRDLPLRTVEQEPIGGNQIKLSQRGVGFVLECRIGLQAQVAAGFLSEREALGGIARSQSTRERQICGRWVWNRI